MIKKIIKIIVLILGCGIFLAGCFDSANIGYSESILRIHIRANSNSIEDQEIKYDIKAMVVEYLTPIVAEINSKEDLINSLNYNKSSIENIINAKLKEQGFNYLSNMKISNELFPTRTYGEYTFEADYYDALIVELGEAKGDNWWCVVYPPLCFKSANTKVVYKSKILEIINQFFN